MKKRSSSHILMTQIGSVSLALAVIALAIAAALSLPDFAQAQEGVQTTQEYCLSCHGNPDLSITLPSGEELPLYIPSEILERDAHNQVGIECHACHDNITTYPHPEIDYDTRRELGQAFYLSCRKCHENNYAEAQDSIHAQMAEAGNPDAPICTDCHGAHEVLDPDEPRLRVSETCGQCHSEIFEAQRDSVHGAALREEGNEDVPVCTDCHGVHNIPDPRTSQFQVETPELCAGCHADEELMSKYGLDADVYSTYRISWHGVDVEVFQARWPNLWHQSAVCTDCHGVHDMLSTENPNSRVHPDNLLETCRQCHPQAPPNWTGAWTGHYEISLQRTPFVFYTEAFYESFTPFVLWLSGIYVFLQLTRRIVARARRSL